MSSAALSLHAPARKPPPAALVEIRGFKLRIQGLETQAIPGLAVVLGTKGGDSRASLWRSACPMVDVNIYCRSVQPTEFCRLSVAPSLSTSPHHPATRVGIHVLCPQQAPGFVTTLAVHVYHAVRAMLCTETRVGGLWRSKEALPHAARNVVATLRSVPHVYILSSLVRSVRMRERGRADGV